MSELDKIKEIFTEILVRLAKVKRVIPSSGSQIDLFEETYKLFLERNDLPEGIDKGYKAGFSAGFLAGLIGSLVVAGFIPHDIASEASRLILQHDHNPPHDPRLN